MITSVTERTGFWRFHLLQKWPNLNRQYSRRYEQSFAFLYVFIKFNVSVAAVLDQF